MSSSDEQRIDRIRRLELKGLGREKLLSGGGNSDQPEASRIEGKKKKKRKFLVKGGRFLDLQRGKKACTKLWVKTVTNVEIFINLTD